jgi:ABC-type branched-subunit amino acid transport system ATPase component
MVEQNALAALAVSDHAAVMVDGRVARAGDAQAIAVDPQHGSVSDVGAERLSSTRADHCASS